MRNGIPLIKKSEGCRLKAYPDPATGGKPWTIAYGRTLNVKPGDTCTQEQADAWLIEEYDRFERNVLALIAGAKTTPNQLGAMVCLSYNIGLGNFAKSSVLANHRVGRYANAAAAFLMWDKAAGHVMAGLVTRRHAESALYSA